MQTRTKRRSVALPSSTSSCRSDDGVGVAAALVVDSGDVYDGDGGRTSSVLHALDGNKYLHQGKHKVMAQCMLPDKDVMWGQTAPGGSSASAVVVGDQQNRIRTRAAGGDKSSRRCLRNLTWIVFIVMMASWRIPSSVCGLPSDSEAFQNNSKWTVHFILTVSFSSPGGGGICIMACVFVLCSFSGFN